MMGNECMIDTVRKRVGRQRCAVGACGTCNFLGCLRCCMHGVSKLQATK